MHKKLYRITNTAICGINRESLKQERKAKNLEAGVDEEKVNHSEWPHKITKGPHHPHKQKFFSEIAIGQHFALAGTKEDSRYVKINAEESRDHNGTLVVWTAKAKVFTISKTAQ